MTGFSPLQVAVLLALWLVVLGVWAHLVLAHHMDRAGLGSCITCGRTSRTGWCYSCRASRARADRRSHRPVSARHRDGGGVA